MFAIPFLLTGITYIYLATGIHNTESESILWLNLYHWSTFPIMATLLIAASGSLFEVRNSDKMLKMFLAILAFSCIVIFLPFSIASASAFVRQIMGVVIITISTYLLVKTKVISNLMFLMSMICFTVAGIALARGMTYFSIFVYLMGYIFLTMIFIVTPSPAKKGKHDVSSYFSLKSKLASAKQDLIVSEEKYKTLFNSSPDAIMLMSEDEEILSVNQAMAKGFGVSTEELKGKNIHNLLPKYIDEKRTIVAKKALKTGKIQENEDERDGTYFHNAYVPIFTSDGKKNIQVIARDITKQKKFEEELEEKVGNLEKTELASLNIMEDLQEAITKREAAEKKLRANEKRLKVNVKWLQHLNKALEKSEEKVKQSEKVKSEFMNIAAHELKTPIIPIKGYLELLVIDKNLSKENKEWMSICLRNTNRLVILINDILDVSRLEAKAMKLVMENVNMREVMDGIMEDMQPAANKKNLKMTVNVAKKLPLVNADRKRMSQVLRNLVSNAIKCTNEGGSIIIQAVQQKKHIIISVKDTGVGIAKKDISKLFKKFSQLDSGATRKVEGTGLGLYICKGIVGQHGGEIQVESPGKGKGSTFTFTLPVSKE